MSIFTFVNPANGQSFDVKGPPELTQVQAKAIFDQQVRAGSLVGFKSGDVLSAATQSADQLPGAQAQLAQALSGRGGDLTGVIKNTPATGDIAGQAQSVANRLQNSVSSVINRLPVTNGINIADFAKQAKALVPIQTLSVSDVTAAMASASKLVSQPPSEISNNLGAGKFGFDTDQLEYAGVLKPGTSSALLNQGTNTLTDVLKSPAVYTGKNGINNLDDLLSSVPKQDQIQQQLMSQGLNAVNAAGISVDQLSQGSLAGLANAAAKSVPTALDWAKGLPLPADIKTKLDTVVRDGAFAADFAEFKVDNPMKEIIAPIAAVDTVDRATVDAASQRIVGNDKVPEFQYTAPPSGIDLERLNFDIAAANVQQAEQESLATRASQTARGSNATAVIQDLEIILGAVSAVDSKWLELQRQALALNRVTPGSATAQLAKIESGIKENTALQKLIASRITKLKEILAQNTSA